MIIRDEFKTFEEKKAYLDNLFYNVGKQGSDFELSLMDKEYIVTLEGVIG